MRKPPPVAELPRFPVVGGLALLAIGVTLAYWSKSVDISPLREGPELRAGELWRLVTSILPHVDLMHLVFNVYWLWALGTVVEETLGHAKAVGAILIFAAGSGAAEYALMLGGIGLSGVGYGLFGLLWVLARYDPRFRDAMDTNTAVVFVFWFFLCIVLTVTDVWHVANIAHGVGALFGVMVGWAVSGPRLRAACGGAVGLFLAASIAAAVYGRPYVNLTRERGDEWARRGAEDLGAGRNADAVRSLSRAVGIDDQQAWAWYNLGLALRRVGKLAEARDAFDRAAGLEPGDPDFRAAAGRETGAAPTTSP